MPIQWIWEGTQAPTYFFFNAAQVISASETEIPWIGCPKSQLVPWKREVNCSASLAAELVQKGSLLWPQVNGPGTLEKGPLTFCSSTEDVNLGAVGDRHFFFFFLPNRPGNRKAFFPKREEPKQNSAGNPVVAREGFQCIPRMSGQLPISSQGPAVSLGPMRHGVVPSQISKQ